MELLIVLACLSALGLLAARYGAASRDAARSDEHDLARRGLAWAPALVPVPPLARRMGRRCPGCEPSVPLKDGSGRR